MSFRPTTIAEVLDCCDEERDYYPDLTSESQGDPLYEEAKWALSYEDDIDDPTAEQVTQKVRQIVDKEVDAWCCDQIHDFMSDDGYSVQRLRELAPGHHLLSYTLYDARSQEDRLNLDPRRALVEIEDDTYRGEPTYRINVSHPLADELIEAIDTLEADKERREHDELCARVMASEVVVLVFSRRTEAKCSKRNRMSRRGSRPRHESGWNLRAANPIELDEAVHTVALPWGRAGVPRQVDLAGVPQVGQVLRQESVTLRVTSVEETNTSLLLHLVPWREQL